MRQLLPVPLDDVDPYDAYRSDDPHAPLLRVNMVTSLDGSVTDREGRSGGLGGAADLEVFRTLRALADVVLVGAGTVRAERYGPHRLRADLRERRAADGRPAPAPIAVVTRSLDLDAAAPLFRDAVTPTILVTSYAAARTGALHRFRAEALVAGEDEVDLVAALRALREHGPSILCEGGPTLNRGLLDAGLVDELCITFAPHVVGVAGLPAFAPGGGPHPFALTSALEQDGELLLRYHAAGRSAPSTEGPGRAPPPFERRPAPRSRADGRYRVVRTGGARRARRPGGRRSRPPRTRSRGTRRARAPAA